MQNLKTCNKCGHAAFGVTREYAEAEVAKFNEYFISLSKKKQKEYYGNKTSSIVNYENCVHCGNPHTNFDPYTIGDCSEGATLNPIIVED